MSSSSSILDPDYTFTSLGEEIGLDYRIRKGLARLGHVRPTLVQSKCLLLAINSGRDLLVRARTGSGKTLAYCIPVLQKILIKKSTTTTTSTDSNNNGVSAIIIVPTRELCSQVNGQLSKLSYYCDDVIKTTILSIGRKNFGPKCDQYEYDQQEISLRDNPDIIVATPGGILAHIRSGALNTGMLQNSVETLVIDEADLVLSFGTSNNDLSEIVKVLPRIYQGFLMSATLSPELDTLKKVVLNSPITLRLEQDTDNSTFGVDSVNTNLKQFYIPVPKQDRNLVLYVFLKLGLLKGKGIFFVNTTDSGYRLKLFLEQFHIRSCVLNAELPFRSRINIIEQFNLGNFDYLIATDTSADAASGTATTKKTKQANDEDDDDNDDEDDNDDDDDDNNKNGKTNNKKRTQVERSTNKTNDYYGVSRGMDFYKVSFVVNYDIPPNERSYAHRIGRTARGGSKGVALTFIDSKSNEQQSILESIHESQPKILLSDASTNNLQASINIGSTNNGTLEENNNHNNSYRQSQPVLLDFNLQEIEGFRYRVEDVQRAVTRTAVRETRAAEIKAEILNSDKLQSHFEENTADLQLLLSSSDRIATNTAKVQKHLKHIPTYLLPRGMQVAANLHKKKRKRREMPVRRSRDNNKQSNNDPLRNYDGNDINLDGVQGDDDDDDDNMAEFWNDDDENENDNNKKESTTSEKKIYANTKDGTGRANMSGRKVWQMKHKKGDFSNKKRKSDYKYKEPLGI
jgi:ATP-dependent RNA helicase DDX56/DBP9